MESNQYFTLATIFVLILMTVYIASRKNKGALHYSFLSIIVVILVWSVAVLMQGILGGKDQAQFLFWENMTYVGSALVPVSLIFLGRAYSQSDKGISKIAYLLYVIPAITLIMAFTNEFHHLFYSSYPPPGSSFSTDMFGIYSYVHVVYSYVCLIVGFAYLIYFAIKNSGMWSAQALMVIAAGIIPTSVNVCYTLQVEGFSVYSTPIAFTGAALLYLLAIFRFNMLKVTPIALQTVINRISDSFIVVDPNLNIIDYNKPFIDNFHYFSALRKGENFYRIIQGSGKSNLDAQQFREIILDSAKKNTTLIKDFQIEIEEQKQYYTVEFTPISQRGRVIGIILLFKNITQHIRDMEQIQENQSILLERERLASLGQLIGGIAHNLKTPIMSVAGGIEQLQWLSKEYESSIGDPEVNNQDHKEIAAEMQQWLGKMKIHMGYMSDIISTVKDQASKFNNPGKTWFTVDEMLKRVKILMQHELVKNKCNFKQNVLVGGKVRIDGDINSMVQILDNVIVNAIQAYGNKGGEIILKISTAEDKLLMTISDFASGIDDKVRDRLFKEMVTTKGKHGTGLGLYMSYSTIKGMFRGNMWFDSSPGKGTKFYIQLPIHNGQTTEVGQYA